MALWLSTPVKSPWNCVEWLRGNSEVTPLAWRRPSQHQNWTHQPTERKTRKRQGLHAAWQANGVQQAKLHKICQNHRVQTTSPQTQQQMAGWHTHKPARHQHNTPIRRSTHTPSYGVTWRPLPTATLISQRESNPRGLAAELDN